MLEILFRENEKAAMSSASVLRLQHGEIHAQEASHGA
jgi:hypothetical protein